MARVKIRMSSTLTGNLRVGHFELDANDIGELKEKLSERYGKEFEKLVKFSMVIVNKKIMKPGKKVLKEGDEVSVVPLAAGG